MSPALGLWRRHQALRSSHQRHARTKPPPRFQRKHGEVSTLLPVHTRSSTTEGSMMTTTQDKPGGKPRQRNRKTEPRKQKGEPRNGAPRDPQKEEQVRARSASGENPAPEAVSVAAVTPAGIETAAAAEAAAVEAVAAA